MTGIFQSRVAVLDHLVVKGLITYLMKFQKPRILTENNYPDIDLPQPVLFKKMINEVIFPPENSPLDKYIDTTVSFLKDKIRKKIKK